MESQYTSKSDGYKVSRLIEKAVLDAEASGARVLTLGLLNQVNAFADPPDRSNSLHAFSLFAGFNVTVPAVGATS